jgi:prepilin-type N-terminal cleavage/methylation domain-containing protein
VPVRVRSRQGGRKGFTLLELLVAATVAVILIGAATPSFLGALARFRLEGAVRQVVGDLRSAQSQAVARGELYRLHSGDDPLASQPGRYRLERSPDAGVTWTEVTPWYALAGDFQGVGITHIADSAGPPSTVYEIRFTSRGTAATPGAVTYPLNIVISGSAGTHTIQVRQTGGVRVQ